MENIATPMDENRSSHGKIDILGNLPREIIEKIVLPLTPDGIVKVFNCCKKWQQVLDYDFVWKTKFRKTYTDFEEEPETESYRKIIGLHSSRWLGRYMYSHRLESNLENGIFNRIPLKLNPKLVYDFIHFDDRCLILGSWGCKIIIINPATGLVEKEIPFSFYDNPIKHGNLLIATHHCDLLVWNIEKEECTVQLSLTFNGINSTQSLQACKHLVAITTRQSEVFVFNLKNQTLRQLEDSNYIYCSHDRMAIAKYNETIAIVDTNFQPVTTINCSEVNKISKLRMTDDFLIAAFVEPRYNTSLSVWSIESNSTFKIPVYNVATSRFHVTARNKLICAQTLNSFEVWDLREQRRLFRIDIDFPIPHFSFDDRHIFLPGNEFPIWCLRTKKFIPLKLNRKKDRFVASTSSKLVVNFAMNCKEHWQIIDFEKDMLKNIT